MIQHMFVVGLTGGIGSGKTYVASLFGQLGIAVYDSDTSAKRLMSSDTELKQKIVHAFGQGSYLADHSLNRSWLASQVFVNPEKLNILNAMVHPAVGKDFKQWLEAQTSPYVIKETALLFEADLCRHCHICVLVIAPEELRIRRLQKRSGWSIEQIKQRMAAQWDDDKKRVMADHVVYNDGSHSTVVQVLNLHHRIMKRISLQR